MAAHSAKQPDTHKLRVFTFVAQFEVLIVWIIFSVLFWLISLLYEPGVMEILAASFALIIAIPFIQYGFVIVEYSAKGHNNVPRMNADIMSMDGRTYRLLGIGMVFGAALASLPPDWQAYGVILALMVTPAITSMIAFYASILDCLNPLKLFGFMTHMGITYVALRLVGNSGMLIIWYFVQRGSEVYDTPGGLLIMVTSGCYLVLTMFRGTGGLLHLRHRELGIDTDFSSERAEKAREKWREKEHRKLAIRLSKLVSKNRSDEASKIMNSFLAENDFASSDQLLAELERIGGAELANRLTPK